MDKNSWKKYFGCTLDKFLYFGAKTSEAVAREMGIDKSTVNYWREGKRLPRITNFYELKTYLDTKMLLDEDSLNALMLEIEKVARETNLTGILHEYDSIEGIASHMLFQCYQRGRGVIREEGSEIQQCMIGTQAIKVVVFDFDGTLTIRNNSIWEKLWVRLGYDIRICQELQMQFIRREISHKQWCELTEEKFIEKGLNKASVEAVADDIELLPGVQQVFEELQSRDIRIYIVSGSVKTIIRKVLGNLTQYVEEIKANQFEYNKETGALEKIIGTRYDFEGKAKFIKQISEELEIEAEHILFIGNSLNDKFAYKSGARTLCINPQYVDISNFEAWNRSIIKCDNLNEIIRYI